MSRSVTAVELSKNAKTGPVSATYASQKTCPQDCVLLESGCYAEHGRVNITRKRLNSESAGSSAIDIAHEEADAIDRLSGGRDLRLHVVGDCSSDESARVVSGAAERFMARGKNKAWTYTHGWRDVGRESWGSVSVLASCHDKRGVESAMDRGYATCLTVETMPTKACRDEKGVTFIPCLEQSKGTKCADCRLCFNDRTLKTKRLVVLFALHGQRKKAIAGINGGRI